MRHGPAPGKRHADHVGGIAIGGTAPTSRTAGPECQAAHDDGGGVEQGAIPVEGNQVEAARTDKGPGAEGIKQARSAAGGASSSARAAGRSEPVELQPPGMQEHAFEAVTGKRRLEVEVRTFSSPQSHTVPGWPDARESGGCARS